MEFNNQNYRFSIGEHHDKNVIFVFFPDNPQWQKDLKEKFPAAKWSTSKKCWYIPDRNSVRKKIGITPKTEMREAVINRIHPVNQPALRIMHEMLLLKAYSPNTVRAYCIEFSQLLFLLKDKHVDLLTPERLRAYFLYCVTKLKLSENIIHSRMNAIKFYFEKVLHRDKLFFGQIPRPRKKSSLPKVISKNDIAKLYTKVKNLKHLLMLKLSYGAGLRVSEVVNLKIANVDIDRMLVHIEATKGKKDRYVNLPSSMLTDLYNYYKDYRPKIYLFEGKNGGQYAVRSVQAVFKNALQKAKIKKSVGIHGLRQSYVTHLQECGTNMIFLEDL